MSSAPHALCSGLKRPIFSAGNDLNELYPPTTSRERYRRFWAISNAFLADLYVSPLVTIAAVRGACPAGGCCLALACDYRVLGDASRIGLNEARPRRDHLALQRGSLRHADTCSALA